MIIYETDVEDVEVTAALAWQSCALCGDVERGVDMVADLCSSCHTDHVREWAEFWDINLDNMIRTEV